MSRRGPKTALTPDYLLGVLDACSTLERGGHPVRQRKYINGVLVTETDARMIRRWRTGTIKGVTEKSANALLSRYDLPHFNNQED